MIEQSVTRILPNRKRAMVATSVRHQLSIDASHATGTTVELVRLHQDGTEVLPEMSMTAGAANGVRLRIGILRDITERKALEAELTHHAFHDHLTGSTTPVARSFACCPIIEPPSRRTRVSLASIRGCMSRACDPRSWNSIRGPRGASLMPMSARGDSPRSGSGLDGFDAVATARFGADPADRLGPDWQAQGIAPNRTMIQTFCDEVAAQGLIARPLSVEELFADSERALG